MGLFSRSGNPEGSGGKVFDTPLSPVQIVKKAEKQMRREKILSAGREYAPTLYTVLVNGDDDQRLFGFYPTLAGECETRLSATAAADGLTMDGQPLVRFIVDDTLRRGKFDIVAEVVSASIVKQLRAEEMQRYSMSPASAQAPAPAPHQAAGDLPHPAQPMPAAPADPYARSGAYETPYRADQNAAYPQYDAYAPETREKPPLPRVPKEEIDYSLDYGEYTFDSKNFADYDDKDAAAASRDAQANDGQDAFDVPSPVSNPLYSSHKADSVPLVFDKKPRVAADAPAAAAARAEGEPDQASYQAHGQVFGLPEIYPAGAPAPAPAPPAPRPAAPAPYTPAGRVPEHATTAFTGGAQASAYAPSQGSAHARLVNTVSMRTYDLATNRILIGRETSNDIVVNDLNTSRHHAEIRFEPQGVWVITDLGSTNGTYVNGQFVTRRGLQEGDRITLGVTDFVFTLR